MKYGVVLFMCSLTGHGKILDRYNKDYDFESDGSLSVDDVVRFSPKGKKARNVLKASGKCTRHMLPTRVGAQ